MMMSEAYIRALKSTGEADAGQVAKAGRWAIGEIERLIKQRDANALRANLVTARYLPCPDHRDKHSTGDECLMCQLSRWSTEVTRLRGLVRAVASETSIPMEEIEQSIDSASDIPAQDDDRGSNQYANPPIADDKQECGHAWMPSNFSGSQCAKCGIHSNVVDMVNTADPDQKS